MRYKLSTYLINKKREDGSYAWTGFKHTHLFSYEITENVKDAIRLVKRGDKVLGFYLRRDWKNYNYDVSVSDKDLTMYMLQVEDIKENIYDY